MEASTSRRPLSGGSAKGILSSRRGSLIVAAAVALVALILIFLFVDNRNGGGGLVGGGATRVLVASALIPKGSSGDVVAARGLSQATTLDNGDVKSGAIADPSELRGKIATQDIYPGQQLTASSFKSGSGNITAKLAGDQRAVAVPVDPAHGMIGTVRTGDRVDVFVAVGSSNGKEPAVRALLQNVMVLDAPDPDSDNGNIVLRAASNDAAKLAFASDNGKIWVALRPPVGAANTKGSTITLDSLLAGTSAVPEGSD